MFAEQKAGGWYGYGLGWKGAEGHEKWLKRLAGIGFHRVSQDMTRRLHFIPSTLGNHGRFLVGKKQDKI